MTKKWSQFILLFFINFTFFMGHNSMNILPAYLSRLGAGSGITAIISTFPSMTLVVLVLVQLIRGKIFHKMKIIRLGFILTPLAMGGMFLFRKNISLLFFMFLPTGIAYAAGFTNLFSMMYDVVPKERHRAGAALFGISGLMTSGIASTLAQYVFNQLSPTAIFLLPAIFHITAFCLTFFIRQSTFSVKEQGKFNFAKLKEKNILQLIFQALIYGGAFGIFKSFLPLITESRLGQVDIARFYSVFTVMGISYRLLFARWMDRFKHSSLLFFGFLIAGGALAALSLIRELYQLYLIGGLFGLAHSFTFPTFSAEFVKQGDQDKTAFNNIFLAMFTCGISLITSSLGFLGDKAGIDSVPLIMSILLVTTALFVLFQNRDREDRKS